MENLPPKNIREMYDMNEMSLKRGFDLLGEAYQESFDELRAKINEKVELSDLDTILLADFIQTCKLDHEKVLDNLDETYAVIACNCLKKAEALSDACLYRQDLVILQKIMRNKRVFSEFDVQKLLDYATKDYGVRGNTVKSMVRSCAYYTVELEETALKCLKGDD